MALSSVSYPGDGSNTLFAVNIPYLSKAHVKVYIDGVEDTAFTWLTSSSINTSTVAAIGEIVLIKRTTPSTPLVDFVDGSTLTEELLDTATVQSLYVAEESADSLTELILLDLGDNKFDGNDKVIKNVANPVNPQDVATKLWSETSVSSQVGQAVAAAVSAAASSLTATTQAGIATTKASEASVSAATATTKAGEAATSAATALTKAGEASTSAATATTKAGEAATSASNAAISEANALASKNTAVTSASNASTSATNAANSASAAALSAAVLARVGEIIDYPYAFTPSYALFCNGAAVSSATYAALFAKAVKSSIATMTIASPAVISWTAHGLYANAPVFFTTTGALPTGIVAGTTYYVIAAGLAADSFRVSATIGGAAINTTGSQSGVHTAVHAPHGCATNLSTFNVPNIPSDYTTVQANANEGVATVGQVINHVHSGVATNASNSANGAGSYGGATSTTGNPTTGGAANKAAGLYVRKCIVF
jgi:hypothetical protein